jgi:rhamnosyl/mannosyltransferase
MLGHVPFNDLPCYYQACDVFCMPSTVRAEAYGVAMVEAMVMGKPIVASDIAGSGVPWVNTGTGINLPVGQPGPLATTLRQLMDDTALRKRLGAAARQRYLQEFNAELMTRRAIDLYRRLLQTA